jgi:hypothetical protein
MFSDVQSKAGRAERFEEYKTSLADTYGRTAKERPAFIKKVGIVRRQGGAIEERIGELTKALGPDASAGVMEQIEALKALSGDLNKDWTANGVTGLPDGLSVYDLEIPSQKMVPFTSPIRNRLPRTKGQGEAAHVRQIISWTGSQTGTPDTSSFFNSETGTSSWGSVSLRRPPKISYTGNELNITYMEQGLSDSVTWKAEYAGMGFEDLRSLSHSALLYATMTMEEKNLLFARGTTANGYSGPVAAATIAATNGTGGSLAAGTYMVKVTSMAGGGESVVSNEVSATAAANGTITVTVTEPVGSLGVHNVYMTAVGGGTGTETLQGQFVGSTILITAYVGGGAVPPSSDSTANANAYDGFLTVQAGASTGYFKNINGTLSTSNPGVEFQNAFAAMYNNPTQFGGTARLADPTEIWLAANIRKELGDLLKNNASTSAYRLEIVQDETGGARLGTVVNGIYNQTTGTFADLDKHPYIYPGTALLRSPSLPEAVPDHPPVTAAVRNVQDYMAYDWQPIQMSWDCSTYEYGTLEHFAPAWSGLLVGIQ